jgi:hypothetical protein
MVGSDGRAANATINRERTALKRMYTRWKSRAPPSAACIPMLKEDNVRHVFFERDHFEAAPKNLPDCASPS